MRERVTRYAYKRLERVLLGDKIGVGSDVAGMLKSDIERVLTSYMEIRTLDIDIKVNEKGGFDVRIEASASKMSPPKIAEKR